MSPFVRSLAAGAIWAAVGLAAVIPFLLWGNDKAPEFYGAFMAAIVAAIAVVLGAYYQAELTRRRDDEIARREEIADATDLFLWLGHAIGEMRFIASLLGAFRERLSGQEGKVLEMSIDQYREVVSGTFWEEIRERAKVAARLSPSLGTIIAPTLYDTFLAVDRIYHFRGASPDATFRQKDIENHLFVTERKILKLEKAKAQVGAFLVERGAPVVVSADDEG